MKQNLFRPLFICLCVCFCTSTVLAATTPKSLVVMLDGVRADAFRMAETPNIDSLRDASWAEGYRGAWSYSTHTIKDAPADSAPNHTAIATGVTANKSHVKGNGVFADYNRKNACISYKHYLSRIKLRFPEKAVVFLHGWPPTGILMSTNNTCDLLAQGKDDENARRAVELLNGTYAADGWKTGTDVDALCLYIDLPDAAGHAGGFSLPGEKHDGYIASIVECDGWIGQMLDAIRKRPKFETEDWQIIVCADHGGWIGGHGHHRAETFTVPLVVTGKTASQGGMPGQPCTADVAPTVLEHFGFDIEEMKKQGLIDGSARGKMPPVERSTKTIRDDLIVYLTFDDPKNHGSDQTIQAENHGATFQKTAGKSGGYLEIRPSDKPQFVSLGNSESMKWGSDGDFSVAFWFRMPGAQKEDPVLFGNKDWANGRNPGLILFAFPQGQGNNIGLNLADGEKQRVDVKQFYAAPNEWNFCAVTVDRKHNATLYVGDSKGKLFFGNENLRGESLGKDIRMEGDMNSPLPWNIGQDGTGVYGPKPSVDIDEFRIWKRALSLEEVESVFKKP